ncbi:MAG TPA: ComF family protein [Gammaproteobacteria bacterium]
MVYNWPLWLLRGLLPCHCRLCQAPDPTELGLCAGCRDDLPWLGCACPLCARPLAGSDRICGACLSHPPAFDRCIALFRYAAPLDGLLLQLKFAQAVHLARVFATLLAERVSTEPPPDCILPVPLHPGRQRERGFNQSIEIARPLARHLGCDLDLDTCIRRRDTPPQSRLSARARRRNLQDAFALTRAPARHIALLDDVMTTGSTLNEMTRLLRQGGAERIEVWVCART